ncbi:hypothetical protein N9L68_00480 [bacterium]|nr:hypothetical protein [bacterium]
MPELRFEAQHTWRCWVTAAKAGPPLQPLLPAQRRLQYLQVAGVESVDDGIGSVEIHRPRRPRNSPTCDRSELIFLDR